MAADIEIVITKIMLVGRWPQIGVGRRLPRRAAVKDWLGCVEIVGREREIAGEMPDEADDPVRFHNDRSHSTRLVKSAPGLFNHDSTTLFYSQRTRRIQ